MNKKKFDRDKCQFLDSDPKTQLHMDAVGGEVALQQTAHVRKVKGFMLTEILVSMRWLPKPGANSGGIIRGPMLKGGTIVRPASRATYHSAPLPMSTLRPTTKMKWE